MLIAESFRAACVVGLIGTAALVSLRAQEAPAVSPAQEQRAPDSPADQAPSRIFGPVRRTPPSAPEEFLLQFPQHRSDAERLPWFGSNPGTSTQGPRRISPTPQPAGERPVCLRTVTVDPKLDPQFVQPVPDLGAVIQRVVPPPCVQTTEPISRP
jgi:hypothetical protein